MSDSELGEVTGKLMKVLSVDHETQQVHARAQDGLTTRFGILQGELPTRGDTILLSENRWERAPADAWTAPNNVATVRAILDDGDILVDDGIVIRPVINPAKLNICVHNTIEYNEIDGIVRVVSDNPIRSRDFGIDRNDIIKEYLVDTSGGGPSFADFGGYPNVLKRARELIETQLDRGDLLNEIGARPVKGILFTGPPGTGKTHLARIIAHESRADFFLVSGPSIVSKWVGDTEDTLRKIFDAAASSVTGRAIIFFDEIDSIAERRTGETHEASKRLVAQLLTLMDGFSEQGTSVVVIAATNRVDTLDPAVTRPGRFDWEIQFGMPNVIDRMEILEVGSRKVQCDSDLPLLEVAIKAHNWSAARLTSIWTEAALIAAGDGRKRLAGEDIAQAYERVASRPERSNSE